MMICSAASEKPNHSVTGMRTKPQESRRKEKSVFLRELFAEQISRKLNWSGKVLFLWECNLILLLYKAGCLVTASY